jgi:mannose-6-phosphate isomerase-like protein (cupin superfamily)
MKEFKNGISLSAASNELKKIKSPFIELFSHGTLTIELYKPDKIDLQKPHTRDEAYIIASGSGYFLLEDKKTKVETGDFLFVEAHREHRFVNFSEDFSTWVLFYGPVNGEKSVVKNLLPISMK